MAKIKYIPCEATGETMLEIDDEKITALEACTIYFGCGGDEGIMALKKGESMPLPKVK